MAWFARVALGYVCLMILLVAALQFLARADHGVVYVTVSGDRLYLLTVYRDVEIPAIFGGAGRAPGEISVTDRRGRTLDSEHIDDVTSVRDIHWERYRVDFEYDRGGRTYETSLALLQ